MNTYSPAAPERYTAVGDRSGLGQAFSSPDPIRRATWNLLYLSWPGIDLWLDTDGVGPFAPEILQAVSATVFQELGGRAVADWINELPADAFVRRLNAFQHTHLALYQLLGSQWLRTVAYRAGVCQLTSEIIYVDFRNRQRH